MLQAGRSRNRFPMRYFDFISIDLILPPSPWPMESSQPRTEMSIRNLRGNKGRPERKVDHTSACEPIS
jgi:hypothetical protein